MVRVVFRWADVARWCLRAGMMKICLVGIQLDDGEGALWGATAPHITARFCYTGCTHKSLYGIRLTDSYKQGAKPAITIYAQCHWGGGAPLPPCCRYVGHSDGGIDSYMQRYELCLFPRTTMLCVLQRTQLGVINMNLVTPRRVLLRTQSSSALLKVLKHADFRWFAHLALATYR